MSYEPDYESLARHVVPDWYHDAKLGIFVHWGLYSVPAWAPRGRDIRSRVAEVGWARLFRENPYAEWYQNSLRIDGSPTRGHHTTTYGPGFGYESFAPMFESAIASFDPDAWARLFHRVGARYVVLTTKHHDGYLLWPSSTTSPRRPDRWASPRDLVGEVVDAARRHGLRAGLYYSGGLDWTFEERPVCGYMDVYSTIVQDPAFVGYVTGHWRELIERFAPEVLWNDIGSPRSMDLASLFADYYEAVPDGVVNDRWSQQLPEREPGPGEHINPPHSRHHDFTTPEYATYEVLTAQKWEASRGIGQSYGFNQAELADDHLSVTELVHLLVDIVSKNGNLLLNVGPSADGTIPPLQLQRLEGLGAWLATNGEAVFGTRPWFRAEGVTADGTPVRYTRNDGTLFATILGDPSGRDVVIRDLRLGSSTKIRLVGEEAELPHREGASGLSIGLPGDRAPSPALSVAISPVPALP